MGNIGTESGAKRRQTPHPLEGVWRSKLEPILERAHMGKPEAKTLLEALVAEGPTRFSKGQLRTMQRRLRVWRALKVPPRRSSSRRSIRRANKAHWTSHAATSWTSRSPLSLGGTCCSSSSSCSAIADRSPPPPRTSSSEQATSREARGLSRGSRQLSTRSRRSSTPTNTAFRNAEEAKHGCLSALGRVAETAS